MSTHPPVSIRAATRDDLPFLGRLGALLVSVHHELDPERFFAATPETERGYASFLSGQLGDPDVVILVAERASDPRVPGTRPQDVIGYAYGAVEGYDYMSLRGPAGVLHDVVVDPDQRGRGVGRMLLDAVLAELAARGAPRVVLATGARNEGALRLFARAGFRATMLEMTREL